MTDSEKHEKNTDAVGNRQLREQDMIMPFERLPIEKLIPEPASKGSKGQQKLPAMCNDDNTALDSVKFTYERKTIDNDKNVRTEECQLNVPLLSIVPIPALAIDELSVDFDMDVKKTESFTANKSSHENG